MSNDPSQTLFTCKDRSIDLKTPAVMGILNVTPDSFSDGGRFLNLDSATERIAEMVEEGADIIDVGGESTRPGSDPVSADEELERTIPVIQKAADIFRDVIFSIDTTKYEVAKAALNAGAHIINDVSGLDKEPRFAELCAETGAGYVCMHSQGDPKTMQKDPQYQDVVMEIFRELFKKVKHLRNSGVKNILVDPGIGFGKTLDHNLKLVSQLHHFSGLECPVMVGASRKSMLGKILNNHSAEDRVAATVAIHYHCLMRGASVIRVHDVQEAVDSVKIFNAVQSASNYN